MAASLLNVGLPGWHMCLCQVGALMDVALAAQLLGAGKALLDVVPSDLTLGCSLYSLLHRSCTCVFYFCSWDPACIYLYEYKSLTSDIFPQDTVPFAQGLSLFWDLMFMLGCWPKILRDIPNCLTTAGMISM